MQKTVKTAFLFPGQGAQLYGMGKDFYQRYQVCKDLFHQAEEICEIKIRELCFEQHPQLHQTKNLQPCLFTVCAAIHRAAREEGLVSQVHAGLSLGEYVALDASGVMEVEELLLAVKLRGSLMDEAYTGESAMVAVMSPELEAIEKTVSSVEGIVSIANYNTPSQTVLTGEKSAVNSAVELLRQRGIKHCFPLHVSGPFHSILMEPAKQRMSEFIEKAQVKDPIIPYISNVTGDYVSDKKQVKELLLQQIVSPVKWYQGIQSMIEQGVERFIELGPGKSLTNMLFSIDPSVEKRSISSVGELRDYVDKELDI